MRMSLKLCDLWWEKMKNGSSYHKLNFLDCHQFIASSTYFSEIQAIMIL